MKTAILSILAASLVSFAAVAQDEVASPEEDDEPDPETAPAAAPEAAPRVAPAPAPAAAPSSLRDYDPWTARAPAPADVPEEEPAGYPDEYALRPLTLAANTLQITMPFVLTLSKNAVLKRVEIPLDVRGGLTNRLEVFISHTRFGLPMAIGGGVCIGEKGGNCQKTYGNTNFGAQFSLVKASGAEVSGLLALDFRQLSNPMLLAWDVGIGFKYVAAPVSVKIAPQIGILLTNRSGTTSTTPGNSSTSTYVDPASGQTYTTTVWSTPVTAHFIPPRRS
jgi:hypothetical protein